MEDKELNIIVASVIIVVFAIVFIIIGYKVGYNSIKCETKPVEENNQVENTNKETSFKVTTSDCNTEVCETEHNNNKVVFSSSNISDNEKVLKINDIDVLPKMEAWTSAEIYFVDSLIVVLTNEVKARSTYLYIFDDKADTVNKLYALDSKYPDMVIEKVTVFDDKISIDGTRLTTGPSIYSMNPNGEVIDSTDLSKCDVYNKYANEVVSGKYELIYIGSGKYANLTNLGYVLVKDSLIKCV